MTRQHFKALAEQISQIRDMDCRKEAANAVAIAVRQFNSAFDRSKFMAACGIDE